jgi:predicted transcriptional regulator
MVDAQKHEFLKVGRLIPDEQEIVRIGPRTTVGSALQLMQQHEFDQLPVVAGGEVVGVFTYRSLARGLGLMRRQDDPLDAEVDDLTEDLEFVRSSDDVAKVLRFIDRDGAVLVGDETNLLAVATSEDVTRFLWAQTHPFVLLQDIELATRELGRLACPSEETLIECVRAAFPPEGTPHSCVLEDLTLGELLQVVENGPNYGRHFKKTFGNNLNYVHATLDPVLEIRNKVFHFRGEVSVEELEILAAAHKWLLRKITKAGDGQ